MILKPPKWLNSGQMSDYRYTLAKERTFLSWIRTVLAFLAAAVAVIQFVPDFATLAQREILAILLALIAMLLAANAYRRWLKNEQAMRHPQSLPFSYLLLILSIILSLTVLLILIILLLHWLRQ